MIKRIIVLIVIVIMLGISGGIIYECSFTSTSLKTRYPKTNCKSPEEYYTEVLSHDDWERDAYNEYLINKHYLEHDKKTHYTDTLQCFCKHEKKEGRPKTQLYNNDNLPAA